MRNSFFFIHYYATATLKTLIWVKHMKKIAKKRRVVRKMITLEQLFHVAQGESK